MSNTITLTHRKRTLIFITIVVSCIATTLLSTALTTALPAIIGDLKITTSTGQWLTSGYSLVMGIIMPLTAFLITRFPTKKLYLTAMILFIIGLCISAISTNFPIMMGARVFQAIGNGILSSLAQVILLTIYPLEKRGTVMGWYGLSISAAPVIAPSLSGIIVDSIGWRAIFYLSIAIMLVTLIFAMNALGDVLATEKHKFDVLSFVTSATAFTGLTLAIGNLGSHAFLSVRILGFLLLGVASLIFFVYRQLHLEKPFLELRILKNKNFALSVLGSMFLYLVMMGSSVIMPLYIQTILGKSATISGLVGLPGSLAMAFVSPFAGKIYDKIGIRKLFIFGAFCLLVSNFGMYFITMTTPIWLPALYNTARCIAIGCLMMPLVTWGTSSIHKDMLAHGTALLTSLRTIAGAIGSAVFVNIMTLTASHSASTFKENANIHGLNMAFLAMDLVTLLLFVMAVFLVKDKKQTPILTPTLAE